VIAILELFFGGVVKTKNPGHHKMTRVFYYFYDYDYGVAGRGS